MRLLVTNTYNQIKRYFKLWLVATKFTIILETTYRLSFFVELGVELGYQLVTVLFMKVIFSNISEVGGWNYYQILFLTGLNIISSEIIVGGMGVYGLWALPEKIKNGEIDYTLLKPVNSLFALGLFEPYVTGFVGSLSGFYLMAYSANKLGITIGLGNIIVGVILLIMGSIIVFCIMAIFASLTFKFINAKYLPRLASSIAFQFKVYPHEIYQGLFKLALYFAIPVIFMGSVPAAAVIKGVDVNYLILGFFLVIIFLILTKVIWKKMISYYTSASS